jgi:hypothetical protein
MVRIAERVWAAWREQLGQWDEPSLLLLLAPVGDHGDAARALRESVLEVQAAYRAEAERAPEPDPPWTGEWDWVRVSDGVLVQVVECEALESVLPAIAAALERRGIEGAFDLPDEASVATRPRTAHMIECRARVRGARLRRGPRDYLWQADPQAHQQILAAAERWCRRRGQRATESLSVGTVGPVAVEPDEDVLDRMHEAVADRIHVELCAVTADGFRSVAVRAWSGGVTLVEGGAWVEAGHWRRALAELTGVLRDQADQLVYGFVRRGWAVDAALLSDSPAYDWPQRADHQPSGIGFTPQAFDDVFAPDAFAVQLLGPGYAGRAPDASAWRQERAGTAAVLLEHLDLPAWFDAPFVPFRDRTWQRDHPQPPAILARAREALAPILYSPGVLSERGYLPESEE